MKKEQTSWGGVADWYDEVVEEKGSYQKDVILPNLLRVMDIKKGEKVLDLACGQGFFSGEFAKAGADIIGADVSEELVAIAKAKPENSVVKFFVSPADDLKFIEKEKVDKVAIVLALQNIENMTGTIKECSRVLKNNGKLFLVLNHPAFRIPKESSWGFDDEKKIQWRRVDKYLSESKVDINMNPGGKEKKEFTVSFHRSLQLYFKTLKNNGFCVGGLEEWISNKKSQPGKRQEAEDKARKEFPMFMMIEARKM